jgi:hypothetical protein
MLGSEVREADPRVFKPRAGLQIGGPIWPPTSKYTLVPPETS